MSLLRFSLVMIEIKVDGEFALQGTFPDTIQGNNSGGLTSPAGSSVICYLPFND